MSISAEGLSFSYCTRNVLQNVSFQANDGVLLALLGPNGVGKTTLFQCILGLLPNYSGVIKIDGLNAKKLSARQLAHRIASIPQARPPVFQYTVMEMTLMGTSHSLPLFSMPGTVQKKAALEALERVGIAGLAKKNYAHLSGGEQQLVLTARALAQNAKTLLMDEPTASLDYGNQQRVLEQARALAKSGYCVVMSTHDPQHALWYADMALVLKDGALSALGKPADVLSERLLSDIYGINARFLQTEAGGVIVPCKTSP